MTIDGTAKLPKETPPPITETDKGPIIQRVDIPGTDGLNGSNAYTLTTAPFTMPPRDNATPVTISVKSSAWVTPGQPIFVELAGILRTTVVPSGTSIVAVNPGYIGNEAAGTSIGAGMGVSPGGFSGAIGTAAVDGGGVDYTGQPIINQPSNGAHLQVEQDHVYATVDGTYSDGSLKWHGGVWTLLQHSVVRTAAADPTFPPLRIALPPGYQPAAGRCLIWDQADNALYVFLQKELPRRPAAPDHRHHTGCRSERTVRRRVRGGGGLPRPHGYHRSVDGHLQLLPVGHPAPQVPPLRRRRARPSSTTSPSMAPPSRPSTSRRPRRTVSTSRDRPGPRATTRSVGSSTRSS